MNVDNSLNPDLNFPNNYQATCPHCGKTGQLNVVRPFYPSFGFHPFFGAPFFGYPFFGPPFFSFPIVIPLETKPAATSQTY
jgi:hypothetical protein